MNCNYRYCEKEILWGRPDRKFCNKNCKSKENAIHKELKSLKRRNKKSVRPAMGRTREIKLN